MILHLTNKRIEEADKSLLGRHRGRSNGPFVQILDDHLVS